jgi:hypothetical protein
MHATWEPDLAGVRLGAFGAEHEQHVVSALVSKDWAQHGGAAQFGRQPATWGWQGLSQMLV